MKASMTSCAYIRVCRNSMQMQMYNFSFHSSATLSSSSSSSAVSGYRRLLKASRVAFKNHEAAIRGAREELRSNFYKNKDVTDETELKKLFVGIDEVEEMLKFNIVQGERNQRGNYGQIVFQFPAVYSIFMYFMTFFYK